MEGASGPVELPPDADYPDAEIQYDDDDVQAVQSEADNYLIDQSEAACRKVDEKDTNEKQANKDNIKDKEDYCDKKREFDYLGSEHTMCKFCVSFLFLRFKDF